MKILHRHLMLATALATGLAVAVPLASGPVRAEESATVPTNPGFNPGTGQINPGVTMQAPSSSTDIRKIPTPAEARAALLMPISTQPSAGSALADGPQASAANAGVPGGAQTATGQQPAATTGAATSEKAGTEPAASISSGPSATAAAGSRRPARSARPARLCRPNSPNGMTFSTGCRSWHGRRGCPIRIARKSIRR